MQIESEGNSVVKWLVQVGPGDLLPVDVKFGHDLLMHGLQFRGFGDVEHGRGHLPNARCFRVTECAGILSKISLHLGSTSKKIVVIFENLRTSDFSNHSVHNVHASCLNFASFIHCGQGRLDCNENHC